MKKIFTLLAFSFVTATAIQAQTSYTGIIKDRQSLPGITLLSNPVNGVIRLSVNSNVEAKYQITLYTSGGVKITSLLYSHSAGESTVDINVPAGLQQGIYYLTVVGRDGNSQKFNVMIR